MNMLSVVNDASERAIKLVTEFANCFRDDQLRQDLLLAVQERRSAVHGIANKTDVQTAYQDISRKKK